MSTKREPVFVTTSKTTWDLLRFVQLPVTLTSLTPSSGHNHSGNKRLTVRYRILFKSYINHCAAHQKSTAPLWVRKQLTKHNPHHTLLWIAWTFSLTNPFINNNYDGPLLLHWLPETHSRLHCLPTCLWASAQDCFFWMKFVIGWNSFICLFSLVTSVRSCWDLRFILLSSEKAEKTHVCKGRHVFYIMRTYCICDLWPLNWLLLVINTHQFVPSTTSTHINPSRQISLSVPSAYLDSLRHLWTASTK